MFIESPNVVHRSGIGSPDCRQRSSNLRCSLLSSLSSFFVVGFLFFAVGSGRGRFIGKGSSEETGLGDAGRFEGETLSGCELRRRFGILRD